MIDIATLKQNIHTLLGWNMQPLSTTEILASGDALHCPACKKLRYVMFKAATADTPMVYAGSYCVCVEVNNG